VRKERRSGCCKRRRSRRLLLRGLGSCTAGSGLRSRDGRRTQMTRTSSGWPIATTEMTIARRRSGIWKSRATGDPARSDGARGGTLSSRKETGDGARGRRCLPSFGRSLLTLDRSNVQGSMHQLDTPEGSGPAYVRLARITVAACSMPSRLPDGPPQLGSSPSPSQRGTMWMWK
jgi:hypothetical protein